MQNKNTKFDQENLQNKKIFLIKKNKQIDKENRHKSKFLGTISHYREV